MAGFIVTARVGPRVGKERYATLDEALMALAAHVGGGGPGRQRGREVLGRSYTPEQLVSGRFELRGPGVRGGVDVRGDGSAEAFTGRIRKVPVERRGHETAVQALERVLRAG